MKKGDKENFLTHCERNFVSFLKGLPEILLSLLQKFHAEARRCSYEM